MTLKTLQTELSNNSLTLTLFLFTLIKYDIMTQFNECYNMLQLPVNSKISFYYLFCFLVCFWSEN